jgi:Na+/melibiose symporter-like transporter
MKSPAKPYQRFLVLTMVPIGVAAFILKLVTFFYLDEHSPKSPRPETGEIYLLTNHGDYFYVTHFQSVLQGLLLLIFFVFVFGGVALNYFWKVVGRPA